MAGARRYGKTTPGTRFIGIFRPRGSLLTFKGTNPAVGQEGIMASPSPAEDREVAYRRLIDLGIALSAEHNHDRLLETILLGAKELSNADGGTLYLVGETGHELRFTIMRNDTMGIALGGTTGAPIPF